MKTPEEQNILQNNLARFKASDDSITRISSGVSDGLDIGVTVEGHPYLRHDGRDIYQPGEVLSNAAGESAHLLQGRQTGLVVFFGLGLGLHLEFLRAKTEAPIVVFEPDADLLFTVLSQVPLELENVRLVMTASDLVTCVQETLAHSPGELVAGALPVWAQIRTEAFSTFKTTLQQALAKLESDRRTRSEFAVHWINHMARNLPFLGNCKPVACLAGAFAGKPAVLVGAGPSLDLNLDELARLKNHALILAVHSAVIPLAKAGIVPDLVVIIESQQLDHYFKGVDQLGEMILLPSSQTHPIHLDLGFKECLGFSHEGNAASDWLEKAYAEKSLPSGGSVACVSLSLLHELKCDPLMLVGMDLAYSDGRGHASGNETGCCEVIFDEANNRAVTHCTADVHEQHVYQAQKVPGWGTGKPVFTRPAFTGFRDWFVEAGKTWAAEKRLLNCTEGGARIEGYEEMTLAAARQEFCNEQFHVSALMDEALGSATARQPAALAAAVEDELLIIEQAGKKARLAMKQAERTVGFLEKRKLQTVQKELDKLAAQEKVLRKTTLQTRLLNTLVGHRAQRLASGNPGGDEIAQTIHSVQQSLAISEMIVQGAAELKTTYEAALQAMMSKGEPGE